MKQRPLDFQTETVVMRWRWGWLTVRWQNGIRGYFQDWDTALSCVLHPLNERVKLRIR